MEEIGIVFGGGGAKGAYQLGVWKALRELKIEDKIIAVSGNSVGALNAYLFSCENYSQADEIWKYDAKKYNFIDFDIRENGFSRRALERIIDRINDTKYLISDRTSFITTYIPDEKKVVHYNVSRFTKSQIKDILLASSAYPVFYKSININGQNHSDSGWFNNMPIEPVYDMGIRHIILVYLDSQVRGNNLSKFPDCKFDIIAPNKDLGGTFEFDSNIMHDRIVMGYANCIKKYKGDKEMPKHSNANISYKSIEIMERIFASKENVIDFCQKYNKTIKFNTKGGNSFWENIYEVDHYKIQCQTWLRKHIRILNDEDFRIASFFFRDFDDCLEDYENCILARQARKVENTN